MSNNISETAYKTLPVNKSITFRLATRDDLPKLEWAGEYTHFRRVFEQTYHEQLTGQRAMLLADFNNFPIGQVFILFNPKGKLWGRPDPRGYLYSLRVQEPFRHMGIASQLITLAEQDMINRRLRRATIAVAKGNHPAKRLYAKLGYHIYGDDAGNWSYTNHQGIDVEVHEPCWLMEKRLTP